MDAPPRVWLDNWAETSDNGWVWDARMKPLDPQNVEYVRADLADPAMPSEEWLRKMGRALDEYHNSVYFESVEDDEGMEDAQAKTSMWRSRIDELIRRRVQP